MNYLLKMASILDKLKLVLSNFRLTLMQSRKAAKLLLVLNTFLIRQPQVAGLFYGMGDEMSRPSTMPTPEAALPGDYSLMHSGSFSLTL